MDLVTRHARARMQQRGIRFEELEALLDFGREIRAGRGRDLVFFSTSARARAWRARGPYGSAEADRLVRHYAVVGADGTVVTAGHRYRRIQR
jgi:hypothetical protein